MYDEEAGDNQNILMESRKQNGRHYVYIVMQHVEIVYLFQE